MRSSPRQGFTDGFTFAVSPAPKDLGQGSDSHCTVGWSKKLTLNREPPMPALGHKQTLGHVRSMSALPPKADIAEGDRHVRFVPIADIGLLTRSSARSGAVALAFARSAVAAGHEVVLSNRRLGSHRIARIRNAPINSSSGRVPGFEGAGVVSEVGSRVDPSLDTRSALRRTGV